MGWVIMGGQSHKWRRKGTKGIKLLSWFLRLGSFQTFMGGCCSLLSLLQLCFLPQECGFLLWDWGSPGFFVHGLQEQSLHYLVPHLHTSKVSCNSGAPTQHCKGLWQVPLTSLHTIAELGLGLGFLLPNNLEVPHSRGIWCGAGSLRDIICQIGWVLPPTWCLILG